MEFPGQEIVDAIGDIVECEGKTLISPTELAGITDLAAITHLQASAPCVVNTGHAEPSERVRIEELVAAVPGAEIVRYSARGDVCFEMVKKLVSPEFRSVFMKIAGQILRDHPDDVFQEFEGFGAREENRGRFVDITANDRVLHYWKNNGFVVEQEDGSEEIATERLSVAAQLLALMDEVIVENRDELLAIDQMDPDVLPQHLDDMERWRSYVMGILDNTTGGHFYKYADPVKLETSQDQAYAARRRIVGILEGAGF